ILNKTSSAAQLLLADMLAQGPGNFESSGVRLAAMRQDSWQHLKDQASQDVARDEGKNNACTVFDNLSPFDPGSWQYRYPIVKSGHRQHRRYAQNCGCKSERHRLAKPDLVQWIGRKAKQAG